MTIGAPIGRFQNASHEYGQASGENAPVHLERTPLSTGKGIPTLFPKSILGNERLSTFICLVTEAVISLYRFLIFCNLQICKKMKIHERKGKTHDLRFSRTLQELSNEKCLATQNLPLGKAHANGHRRETRWPEQHTDAGRQME